MVGKGFPDLAVGKFGHTVLVENGSKPPSKRRLTEDEEAFWREWRGSVILVESVAHVIEFNRKKSV
jgi:hypothetical protein